MTDTASVGRVIAPPALAEERRARSMLDAYLTLMRSSVLQQFQYRTANYFYMIGMVAEPVIYLVVWSSIARSQGGQVDGYTPETFAAYYIVWTLVRNINIVFTPYGWEGRIKQGELSGHLLRPMHPIHYDIGYFAGMKVVVIVLWLPIALVLSLAFHPSLSPSPLQCVVFFVAIWGAYLIRSLNLWILGTVSVRDMRIWPAVDVVTGGVVLGVALYRLHERIGLGHALAFVVMLVLGAVMIYCFWLAITTGAFWLVRMDEIQELFAGVYRAGMYPVSIYPTWLRFGLTFLVPIAFAMTVPAEAVTSRLGWGTVALAAAVAVLLVTGSRAFWKLGLRHYSGASS